MSNGGAAEFVSAYRRATLRNSDDLNLSAPKQKITYIYLLFHLCRELYLLAISDGDRAFRFWCVRLEAGETKAVIRVLPYLIKHIINVLDEVVMKPAAWPANGAFSHKSYRLVLVQGRTGIGGCLGLPFSVGLKSLKGVFEMSHIDNVVSSFFSVSDILCC